MPSTTWKNILIFTTMSVFFCDRSVAFQARPKSSFSAFCQHRFLNGNAQEKNKFDRINFHMAEEDKAENTIETDEDSYEISNEIWEEIEEGSPSKWMIMKELLGINVFTYILAGAIAIVLSLNAILGPGWLGQKMGLPGTGTYTEVSRSIPQNYDLNKPDNLL